MSLPWWVKPSIGVANLFVFIGALVAASFIGTDTLVATMMGIAGANATNVVSYYFGSSHSAEKKDG